MQEDFFKKIKKRVFSSRTRGRIPIGLTENTSGKTGSPPRSDLPNRHAAAALAKRENPDGKSRKEPRFSPVLFQKKWYISVLTAKDHHERGSARDTEALFRLRHLSGQPGGDCKGDSFRQRPLRHHADRLQMFAATL